MDTGQLPDKECLAAIKKYLPESQKQLTTLISAQHNMFVSQSILTVHCALYRWLPWAIERIEKLEGEKQNE